MAIELTGPLNRIEVQLKDDAGEQHAFAVALDEETVTGAVSLDANTGLSLAPFGMRSSQVVRPSWHCSSTLS